MSLGYHLFVGQYRPPCPFGVSYEKVNRSPACPPCPSYVHRPHDNQQGARSRRCAAAHGDVLTLTAYRDGATVRALSVAFDGRKRVTNESVSAIASRLVNDLERYDCDAVETFADALVSGWEFDYSAYVGDALDRLADAKVLSR